MADGDISKDLLAKVRARVGVPGQEGLLDAHIYAFLNRAQYDIAMSVNDAALPALCELATGTLTASRVGLPSDFMRLRLVRVGATPVVAKLIKQTELDALANNAYYAPTATNPYYHLWYNATDAALRLHVELGDAASVAAYELYYIKMPTDMSDSVDPTFAADLYELRVDYAVKRVRESWEQYDEGVRILEQYARRINTINSRARVTAMLNQGPPGNI